jgi:DTW domain-containing protein YfiP
LKNSHLELFGLPERPDYSKIILPDYENIILHPMGTGILSQEISGKPLNLIIPDGTWSQSRKMIQSERLLSVLPKYRLPPVALPAGLRKSPAPEYHSTLQSIAGALGVLGERSAEEKLFCISRLILKRLIDRRIN